MSKHEKLLDRLRSRPVDFRWDDLVTLFEHLGFTITCGGGSHHRFQHRDGFTFTMSKRHPGGILHRYQVGDALEALKRIGVE